MVYLFQEPQGSADAFEALQVTLAEWGPGLCFEDPVPYVDWNTREEAPSAADAELMCYGCPLLLECGEYGRLSDRTHGVWGGRVWFEGKEIDDV